MNNQLLSSEYSKPEEIDLFQLFYCGIGNVSDQISENEKSKLAELCDDTLYLDIVKVTTDEMDAFIPNRKMN